MAGLGGGLKRLTASISLSPSQHLLSAPISHLLLQVRSPRTVLEKPHEETLTLPGEGPSWVQPGSLLAKTPGRRVNLFLTLQTSPSPSQEPPKGPWSMPCGREVPNHALPKRLIHRIMGYNSMVVIFKPPNLGKVCYIVIDNLKKKCV